MKRESGKHSVQRPKGGSLPNLVMPFTVKRSKRGSVSILLNNQTTDDLQWTNEAQTAESKSLLNRELN